MILSVVMTWMSKTVIQVCLKVHKHFHATSEDSRELFIKVTSGKGADIC